MIDPASGEGDEDRVIGHMGEEIRVLVGTHDFARPQRSSTARVVLVVVIGAWLIFESLVRQKREKL
jgi:hypothetical protein